MKNFSKEKTPTSSGVFTDYQEQVDCRLPCETTDTVSPQGNGGTGPSTTESIENIVGGTYVRFDAPKAKIKRTWPGVRGTTPPPPFTDCPSSACRHVTCWISAFLLHSDMFLHRYVVSRVIWAYMLSIAVTYSITLCLFPGLESEIRNSTLGEWLPILIMATFNMSDFVGKVRGTCLYTSCLSSRVLPNLNRVCSR